MSREHVDHKHLQQFADRAVNLKRDDAREYRAQVARLREKLQVFLKDNPDFELIKMLLSGSLAKRTALKNINDADVAVYVSSAPDDIGELMEWLAAKLRSAFPNFHSDQVIVQNYSVQVQFRGTGLDVDVVPVYHQKEDWGLLVSQEDGSKLKTNIPLHRDFIANRRKKHPTYAQVVRLLKWWVRAQKSENDGFRFKSFMVELAVAKLYDDRTFSNGDDYPETMLEFFDYIAKTDFSEAIFFSDYTAKPATSNDPVRIFDPVNETNNVAQKYTERDRKTLVEASAEAGDAIEAALKAPTLALTLHYWRKILGPSFSI